MANSAEVNVNRIDIKSALRNLSDDQLFELREDFVAKVTGNIHLETAAEEGRSHSAMLLANPVITLDIINEIMEERGLLTEAEKRNRRLSRPVTQARMWLDKRQFIRY